ncbi:MAG: hypothetical protein ACN6O8_08175 [Achromobacter sp.]|uniref:hypothetical protein n=1 Tax=Achromobacter sp. TaxID=134375 RepID=UPI003CFE66E8
MMMVTAPDELAVVRETILGQTRFPLLSCDGFLLVWLSPPGAGAAPGGAPAIGSPRGAFAENIIIAVAAARYIAAQRKRRARRGVMGSFLLKN